MGKRRTGLHPLAYMGVEPSTPPLLVEKDQAPTSNNNENFNIGTLWVRGSTNQAWMLTALSSGTATWTELTAGGSGGNMTFETDSGDAVSSSSIIQMVGSGIVNTTGSSNIVTYALTDGSNGQLLIGGAGTVAWADLTSSNSTIDISTGAGSLDIDIANGTNGQVLIGGGSYPAWASLTSSGGTITFTPGANSLNLEAAGGSTFTWNEITGTSDTMAVGNGYVANNAGLVTLTLPASATFGSVIRVAGLGAGGWKIAQNAGQTIKFGTLATTTGVGGYLSSTEDLDAVELLCVVADTDFSVISSVGNITVN